MNVSVSRQQPASGDILECTFVWAKTGALSVLVRGDGHPSRPEKDQAKDQHYYVPADTEAVIFIYTT